MAQNTVLLGGSRRNTECFNGPRSTKNVAMSAELQALKDYLNWESGAQNRGDSTVRSAAGRAPPNGPILRGSERADNICALASLQVLLHVTHSNLKIKLFEIRLDQHMSVEAVKEKLRTHSGTGSAYMYCATTLSATSRLLPPPNPTPPISRSGG